MGKRTLLHPPFALKVLLTVLSVGLLFASILDKAKHLVLVLLTIPLLLYNLLVLYEALRLLIQKELEKHQSSSLFLLRIASDKRFRGHIVVPFIMGVNLFYVVLEAVIGLATRDAGAVVLSFYYLSLFFTKALLLRGYISRAVTANRKEEREMLRLIGRTLFVLSIIFLCLVLLETFGIFIPKYRGLLILFNAFYVFYWIYATTRDYLAYRSDNSHFYATLKTVNLMNTIVSLFALEGAALAHLALPQGWTRAILALSGAFCTVLFFSFSTQTLLRGRYARTLVLEEEDKYAPNLR